MLADCVRGFRSLLSSGAGELVNNDAALIALNDILSQVTSGETNISRLIISMRVEDRSGNTHNADLVRTLPAICRTTMLTRTDYVCNQWCRPVSIIVPQSASSRYRKQEAGGRSLGRAARITEEASASQRNQYRPRLEKQGSCSRCEPDKDHVHKIHGCCR